MGIADRKYRAVGCGGIDRNVIRREQQVMQVAQANRVY
jgi:hypothetical protein